MQRQSWFELHDSPWFPARLRDLVTESLEAIWNANRTYHPIAPRLREALRHSGSTHVVDLCSGGGGPWPSLYNEVAAGWPLTVRLTDRSPSALLPPAGALSHLVRVADPVDAQNVPPALRGFRTIFSSFHHFDPGEARAILADAFHRREGIAIFEGARRSAKTLALLVGVPVLAWRAAAAARPVRWSRILWTCILPVVPLVLWIDGVLSCLRSYSLHDLRELTAGLEAADYAWQIGEEKSGTVPIRYLIGTPLRPAEFGAKAAAADRLSGAPVSSASSPKTSCSPEMAG